MKAYLVFSLPEDQGSFDITCRSIDMFCVLHEIDQELRSWLKYGHSFKSVDETLEKVRSTLRETMESHGIDLDTLGE